MSLKLSDVYRILKEKRINTLFHANSVVTACSYLKEGALLSRKETERRKLPQTSQSSDYKDKKLRIWNHVFLDMFDLHKHARDTNIYGPVLFVLDIEILKSGLVEDLNITRSNPIHWTSGTGRKRHFFQTADEFKEGYPFRDYPYSSMLMFNSKNGYLPLRKHLREIILDNPWSKMMNINLYDYALGALKGFKRLGPLKSEKFEIKKRRCAKKCNCQWRFKHYLSRTGEHFGL